MRIKRFAITLATLIAGIVGAIFLVAAPAHASSSITSGGGGIYNCTSSNSNCTTSIGQFDKGQGLRMVCWRDDRWATGNYRSNRWFYVKFGNGREGYVHSSKVGNQTSTPNCSNVPAIQATQWALNRVGQNAYVKECLRFVQLAWSSVGKNIGAGGNPANYWRTHDSNHQTGNRPPRGALVFWNGRPGYPDGHVAISLGNGYAVSTYERSDKTVHIMSIDERNRTNGAWYLGWIMP